MTRAGRAPRSGREAPERSTVFRREEFLSPVVGFAALFVAALLIFTLVSWLEGIASPLQDPAAWFAALDRETALETLSNAAEVVAGVLAIAITVVAIVVELAANRYTHRITQLFVREPVNVLVMSFFVLTTVLCLWIAAAFGKDSPDGGLPVAGLFISMLMVTGCLLALLPYFQFVFSFLSPVNVIARIRGHALRAIRRSRTRSGVGLRAAVMEAIEELEDIARGATEHSDRSIAVTAVDALVDLLEGYQQLRDELPEPWFAIDGSVAHDPDFVSMAPLAREKIGDDRLWLEVKILRQYAALFTENLNRARDVCNLIALNTQRVATAAVGHCPNLLDLCLRFMNSYLRASINANDLRTAYYVFDQYRQIAESAVAAGEDEPVIEIADFLRYYGQLGYDRGQSFLLEAVAYDLSQLIEVAVEQGPALVDPLLERLLQVDQEGESPEHEDRLLAVRRAQVQLATLFLERGDEARARRIFDDLKTERPERLALVQEQLRGEERPQYWEFTDRGVNFGYLPPGRRALLEEFFGWFG